MAYKHLGLVLFIFVLIPSAASAQCWYIRSVSSVAQVSGFTGISASITSPKQNFSFGSMALWIGYKAKNGGFVQLGYMIHNRTAYYYDDCSPSSGCSAKVLLSGQRPYWFYEYFPKGYIGTNFYGAFGSISQYNHTHIYSIKLVNDTFGFYINNEEVGNVPYPVISSPNSTGTPEFAAEYTGPSGIQAQYMKRVIFKNLSAYANGVKIPIYARPANGDLSTGNASCGVNTYGAERINSTALEFGTSVPDDNYTSEYFSIAAYPFDLPGLSRAYVVSTMLILLLVSMAFAMAYYVLASKHGKSRNRSN